MSGAPVNGTADFQFKLFGAVTGGAQVGATQSVNGVTVSDGVFVVTLDFGTSAFSGDKRWLELVVRSPAGSGSFVTLTPRQPLTAAPYALKTRGVDGHSLDAADGSPTDALFVDSTGNVGIGTTTPGKPLYIRADEPALALEDFGTASTQMGYISYRTGAGETAWAGFGTAGSPHFSVVNARSGGNIVLDPGSGGVVSVPVLEITGADLAEKFLASDQVEPGMVVAIDPANPGQICLARGAYNTRVAGVVSGANDFSVGAVLGNLPGHEDAPPIALSGRVYVSCDATSGAIQPGDLLTTSDTPGHAMEASDRERSHGAIIGKAIELLRPSAWSGAMPPRALSSDARPVAIDLAGLNAVAPEDRIVLGLETGASTAIVDRVERRSPTSFSVACRLESDPDGFALFSVETDAVAGLIQAPQLGKLYRIQFVGEGVHELSPAEPISIADCATEGDASGPEPTPSEGSEERPAAPTGGCPPPLPNGDVMIYYTPSARAEAGGVNAMNAECQLAVDVANQTYVASAVTNQVTLIFRGEINYTEAGSVESDRNRLKGDWDGYMDQVHADRDFYGGDFVALFVRDSDADACGIAYCTPSGASEGFCVVNWTCASGNFSFAHEIGHLQGCAHNREDAGSGCNADCYSFAHRFQSASQSLWRTVMAYDTDPGTFTRIGRWSNPDILFDGVPCGVWTGFCADDNRFNAATITNTAANREAWRNPRFAVWVARSAPSPWSGNYARPYPTIQAGVNSVFAGGDTPVLPVLHVLPETYPEVITLSKRMLISACGGVVRIGG